MGSLLDNATDAEREVLEAALREMRHAVAERQQMTIYFDPWSCEPGAYVCVEAGYQFEVHGEFRRRK